MGTLIAVIGRIGDKAGSLGALVSAMGCAMCFPGHNGRTDMSDCCPTVSTA